MDKYKVYCETDGWVEVIASAEPTVCPNDAGHTLRAGSAAVIQQDIEVNDGTPTELTLDEYKQLRYKEIDSKSGELISQGFTYQSKTFSLSTSAQTNILALDNTRDDPALTYPIKYNTLDDLDSYDVVDSTDLHNMYLTALSTKKAILDGGTTLKTSVRNATTEAEVDAVIDNR
jgi:hypothetical protein